MNAESILERIDQGSRETTAGILREAQAKAEAIRKASEEKIAAGRENALEQARLEALALDDRMRRMALLDARKAMLAVKREVLDEAFTSALKKMEAMSDEQARAFGLALLLEAAHGDETLETGDAIAWCDQSFVDEANAALQAVGRLGTITLSSQTRRVSSGFVLIRGGMEINCSFAAALESRRTDLEAEVAGLLFEE